MNIIRFLLDIWSECKVGFGWFTAGSAEFAAVLAFTRRLEGEEDGERGDLALYWRSLRRCLLWNLAFWPVLLFAIRITVGMGWLLGWLGIPWIGSCFLLLLVLAPLGIVYAVAKGAATEEAVADEWKRFTRFVKQVLLVELFAAVVLSITPIENNRWDVGRFFLLIGILVLLTMMHEEGKKRTGFQKLAQTVALTCMVIVYASFWMPTVIPAIGEKYWDVEASTGSTIKNSTIAGEERPAFCADWDQPIDLKPEAGLVEIKIDPECFGPIITPPPGWQGWRFNWQNPPTEDIWIWPVRKMPVKVSASTRDFEIKRPFRAKGGGKKLSITLYRVGEEPPERRVVGPNDYGQPYRDPCSLAAMISLNESGAELFNADFREPDCYKLFSKNALHYTFRIVAETAGLEVTTPKDNGFFWNLVPGEEELIKGAEMTIRGTGMAAISAAPDPNQDPNQ